MPGVGHLWGFVGPAHVFSGFSRVEGLEFTLHVVPCPSEHPDGLAQSSVGAPRLSVAHVIDMP